MKFIGLTGGIASGKSTVSKLLLDEKIPVIDADLIAREIVKPGRRSNKLIRKHFGDSVFLPDGNIDRPKLGDIIFKDPHKRSILNQCTHPYVRLEMAKQALFYWFKGADRVVFDVPLLFESKLDRFMGTNIVVYCSEPLQLQRLRSRDGLTEEQAGNRIQAQMPLSEKVEKADIVLDNSSDVSQLKIQVRNMIRKTKPSTGIWLIEYISPLALIALSIVGIHRLAHYLGPHLNTIFEKVLIGH
ncbi:dephospho-CoA kinase [Phycomyces nitens]|nr:dephospho-CoA kinase [Phycomyces nitens]